MCVCSMEFEYLNEVPVLTLDVNDEFKDNKIKCADMIEKVWHKLSSFYSPSLSDDSYKDMGVSKWWVYILAWS